MCMEEKENIKQFVIADIHTITLISMYHVPILLLEESELKYDIITTFIDFL